MGCTSQRSLSALTDTVTSVDVSELSHTGKQATNWAAACTLMLPFFMHSLATYWWMCPLVVVCVAVIGTTVETPDTGDTIYPFRALGRRWERHWKWADPVAGWLCSSRLFDVLPFGITQNSAWRLGVRGVSWETQVKTQPQWDHFRVFRNGLNLFWPMLEIRRYLWS